MWREKNVNCVSRTLNVLESSALQKTLGKTDSNNNTHNTVSN